MPAKLVKSITWIFQRFWSDARCHIAFSFLFGSLGIVLTLASFGILLDLLSQMQSGESVAISIRGQALISETGLTAAIFIVGLVAIAGAGSQYLGERLGLGASRVLLHSIRTRIIKQVRYPASDSMLVHATQTSMASMIQVVSRECSLAAVQAARIPLAITMSISCVIFMAIWEPAATIVVCAVIPFYMLALGVLNRRSTRVHQENIDISDEARQNLSDQISGMELSNQATPVTGEDTALLRTDSIIFERIELVRKVAFLNAVALAVLIIVLLMLARGEVFGSELDWANLIVFIVLLRFAATGVKQVAVASNVISRFFPSLEMAKLLCTCTPEVVAPDTDPSGSPSRIFAVVAERPNRLSVLKGARLLAVHDQRLEPGSLEVRLDHSGPLFLKGKAVAVDVRNLLKQKQYDHDSGVILLAGRNTLEIERLVAHGLVPELVADLRKGRNLVLSWGDPGLDITSGGLSSNQEQSDDIDLMDMLM